MLKVTVKVFCSQNFLFKRLNGSYVVARTNKSTSSDRKNNTFMLLHVIDKVNIGQQCSDKCRLQSQSFRNVYTHFMGTRGAVHFRKQHLNISVSKL